MPDIKIIKNLLTANNFIAGVNRRRWHEDRVLAINCIGSPGSGKTSIIECYAEYGGHNSLGVIVGDLQTSRDAERLRGHGIESVQINTGTGCHLDAAMIADAYRELTVQTDVLWIENVGNLVCPSAYDLGEKLRIVVYSVTEGDDKPFKYPITFKKADAIVINKIDLLPYVSFDMYMVIEGLKIIAPQARVFQVSATGGEGMKAFAEWLTSNLSAHTNVSQEDFSFVLV